MGTRGRLAAQQEQMHGRVWQPTFSTCKNQHHCSLSPSPAALSRGLIEKRLGSFSTNPTTFVKEFRYLSQAYDLTWHDIHVILSSTFTSDERERVLGAATNHADQIHLTDASIPVGAQAVPRQEPGWEYQLDTPEGREGCRHCDQMLQCLIAGLQAISHKVVNFDKLREVTQGPDENPVVFLNRLTEALTLYTRLDPGSLARATVLATHFISQSAPDIRKKVKKRQRMALRPLSGICLCLDPQGWRKASYAIVTLERTLETAFIPLHLAHTAKGSHECLLLLSTSLGNLHPPPPAYVWRFKVHETYDQDSTQVTWQEPKDMVNVNLPWLAFPSGNPKLQNPPCPCGYATRPATHAGAVRLPPSSAARTASGAAAAMAADGADERSPLLSAPHSGHVTPSAPPRFPESGPRGFRFRVRVLEKGRTQMNGDLKKFNLAKWGARR
ncbi:hypothetical protein QTO34_007865 [Cnephaeus nilssonii]|uniref:Core shell protein Gag P30 domain-containing protein n=1 Tax=Cnephaeus nilssonii TaxID=3371016 RepID=A0AA40HJ55_CNENI|nr:hypothetical protein QTO34_007865 [Eptesicus nilssonii]